MSNFIFNTTPSIHQEIGGSNRIGELIINTPSIDKKASIMFVTDQGIMSLGLASPALESLSNAGFNIVIFDQVEADPKEETVLQAVELARQKNISLVIGFGGGSSMDVAKLIALLTASNQEIEHIYGVNQAKGTRLPLVLIPTTAGTGSEVTAISIVTTGVDEKKGVVTPIILPDIALLDAELTIGLPPSTTAATGIDAMVHAIESYTSKNVNNNPLSKMLAKQALSLLGANIKEAVFNGSNIEARSNMLLGSMLAGQAFANSPVASVHALAYPIGSLFHVPHGLSNALVLCEVMRFNAAVCAEQYADLAPYVFPDIDTSEIYLDFNTPLTKNAICSDFIDRMGKLISELGLEVKLRQVGIKEVDTNRLANDAIKQTRLLVNNPREMILSDIEKIYQNTL